MLGVVIALIVILSVMNGLENELRDRLLSLSAHARRRRLELACRQVNRCRRKSGEKATEIIRAQPGVKAWRLTQRSRRWPYTRQTCSRCCSEESTPRSKFIVTDIAEVDLPGPHFRSRAGTDRVIVGEVVAQDLGLADRRLDVDPCADRCGQRRTGAAAARVPGRRRIFRWLARSRFDAGVVGSRVDPAACRWRRGCTRPVRGRLRRTCLGGKLAKGPAEDPSKSSTGPQDHASYFRAIRRSRRR